MSDESVKGQEKPENEREKPDEDALAPLTGRRVFRRRGDIQEAEASSQIWLVSFTDVMALMLTFFVLLFSMTEPARQDWSEITSALQSEFNRFYGAPLYRGTQDAINIDRINFSRALNVDYLEALLETVIADNEALGGVTLNTQQGQLVISLPRALLFDSGEAEVKEDGTRALYALGGVLSRIRNVIEITGHADPRPVTRGDGGFESNWELSMARAANVAAILETVGYERDIAVRGHASGRYQDLQGVVSEEQRLDLARRVDIVILGHDRRQQRF